MRISEWSKMLEKAVTSACEALIAHETELNEFDTQAGDGDCGSTFKLGAKGTGSRSLVAAVTFTGIDTVCMMGVVDLCPTSVCFSCSCSRHVVDSLTGLTPA